METEGGEIELFLTVAMFVVDILVRVVLFWYMLRYAFQI